MCVNNKSWKYNKPIHPICLLKVKGGTAATI
jgi:hypothetical protein